MITVDASDFDARTCFGEHTVDHHDEAVFGSPDTRTAFVHVDDIDDDLLAGLDRLCLQVIDRLVVVLAPLLAAAVAVVLTPHPRDSR